MVQGGKLFLPFLHTVLAEEAQARSVGLHHDLGGMHLADGHECNFGLGTVGVTAGGGDPFPNVGEVCSERHSRSILWVFRRTFLRRIEDGSTRVADSVTDRVKYLYDICLVWTLEVQGSVAVEGDPCELGDCVFRVLPAGASEPAWITDVFTGPVERDPGGHYSHRVWRLFGVLLRRQAALEPRSRIRMPGAGSFLHVPQVLSVTVHTI